jgi:Fe2+ or Zn2+ uptake regulation protein
MPRTPKKASAPVVRSTVALRAVASAVAESAQPLTAAEVVAVVSGVADRATVYRVLERLCRDGQAEAVDLGDGRRRYEPAGEHHHHAVCLRCHAVEHVAVAHEAGAMERAVARQTGFAEVRHRLEFFGVCRACRSRD